MSSKPTSKDAKTEVASTSAQKDEKTPAQPVNIAALEEDDEFEEFPAQDWDNSQTELARLGNQAGADGQKIQDSLWEDNWDDDDIEEEFAAQLRNELAKAKPGGIEPMKH
ncbi:DSS1/SEM1 family-domain-containing protein [Auriculariales sp. MPI-PUGE-AT-0066]|nr:DSS1/SEM1 family-domain-containing protein [Auriculariales sp. MPI-PUGE-AT-0066]